MGFKIHEGAEARDAPPVRNDVHRLACFKCAAIAIGLGDENRFDCR